MSELRRVDRDLPALTVLALLSQGPRHTYEMHRLMVDTHKDFVTGLPRSMYHAVGRLQRDELITAVDTVRDGGRPERTIYRITDAGRRELTDRVRRLLAVPDADTTRFVAALSFLGCLPVAEARRALGDRSAELSRRLSAAEDQLATLRHQLPRLLLVEVEYERHQMDAELAWVRRLLDDLDSGALAWPDDLSGLDLPKGGMTTS